MANYKIIAASRDENGKYTGGAVGDQNGKEVYEYNFSDSRAYYYWEPLTQDIADKIYRAAKALADNNNFGYCQGHRLTGWNMFVKYGSIAKVTEKCECDCSVAERIIVKEALGVDIGNLTTAGIPAALDKLTKYFKKRQAYSKSKKVPTGSLLCTKSKGHTGVLTNGYTVAQCNDSECYPRYTGTSSSIVVALAAVGEKDTSKAHRAKIAAANGIANYNYTAAQNTKMVTLLKAGTLKKA